MRLVDAVDDRLLSADELRTAYAFPADLPCVRGSMVATLDGAIRGSDGSSRSIATAADRRVFALLRRAADVVLVGAGTLRSEDYPPSRLPIAVVTRSGDLAATLRLFSERVSTTPRTIVLTTDDVAVRAPAWLTESADVVPCGGSDVDLRVAIAALEARGLGRIHCEGGPQLLSALAAAGLLDELAVTISPLLHGAESDAHVVSVPGGLGDAGQFAFRHVLEEDGSVFALAVRASP